MRLIKKNLLWNTFFKIKNTTPSNSMQYYLVKSFGNHSWIVPFALASLLIVVTIGVFIDL